LRALRLLLRLRLLRLLSGLRLLHGGLGERQRRAGKRAKGDSEAKKRLHDVDPLSESSERQYEVIGDQLPE
jgi:hypothetical protein